MLMSEKVTSEQGKLAKPESHTVSPPRRHSKPKVVCY
jgi:hypothetical protein